MAGMKPVVALRRVEKSDVAAVVSLVHELAEYEHAPLECQLTAPQMRRALFGSEPALFGHVATVDDEVVGCALWFLNFSTWRGSHGVYLEDLYVRPAFRQRGLGRALLVELARVCRDNGYARMEWSVLDWNRSAIAFYESLGATAQAEWSTYRLTDAPLASLADG